MRQHKYRGISKGAFDKGQWRYGYLMNMHSEERLFIGEWRRIGGEASVKDELFMSYVEVDPSTVGEWTGLDDRNKKEIYEGDILSWPRPFGNPPGKFEVEYANGMFGFWDGRYLCHVAIHEANDKAEVVGNVWENKELLTEKIEEE